MKKCPHCKAPPKEGSGGWATEFTCDTRYGNLSKTICWRGIKCRERTGHRKLTMAQKKEVARKIINAMWGLQ